MKRKRKSTILVAIFELCIATLAGKVFADSSGLSYKTVEVREVKAMSWVVRTLTKEKTVGKISDVERHFSSISQDISINPRQAALYRYNYSQNPTVSGGRNNAF